MLAALWHISVAIRGYLRFYMPTNRAVDWLRTRRGVKWAIPIALVATPAYLGAMAVCAQLALRPGLGWINVLVLLTFWNAAKFAWMAVIAGLTLARDVAKRARASLAGLRRQTRAGSTAFAAHHESVQWSMSERRG